MHASSLLVDRRPSIEPQYDDSNWESPSVTALPQPSLLYDKVGPSVRLRPTAPASFRRALWQQAHCVQSLTLLGFSEMAVDEELEALIVQRGMPLRNLSIISLDLWSATHLQSTTALSVGPALARLVTVPSLQVLHLQRVCMGRSAKHVAALAKALQHHPNLRELCMDVHSTHLGCAGGANTGATTSTTPGTVVPLDTLCQALTTCHQLETLQIYLSGYQPGCIMGTTADKNNVNSLAALIAQLHHLALHMVVWPRTMDETIAQALRTTETLRVLHWTHSRVQEPTRRPEDVVDPSCYCCSPNWTTLLRDNTSLHTLSLSVPANQRAQCWKTVVQMHPCLSSVCLSLEAALTLNVPAFQGKTAIIESHSENLSLQQMKECYYNTEESQALAQALSYNPRLTRIKASLLASHHMALLKLNQGPRRRYIRASAFWWDFVAEYANDLNALWLLLRLHPQSVAN